MSKSIPVILALLLVCRPCEPQEQPKLSVLEGVCAGVVIGFLGGMSIYLVWKCASMIPPVNQDTNPPVWVYPPPPPPPDTNAINTNTIPRVPVLKAEESGLQLRVGANVTGYLTTLQGSDDLKQWHTVAHIQGYAEGTNQWFTAWDTNWHAIAAGPSLFLPVSNKFYRSVRTQ